MRLTIIPSDRAVYVDNVCRMPLDLRSCGIPENVHALQWFETAGWIEFRSLDPITPQPPNENITSLPAWANSCVAVWEAAAAPQSEPQA